MPDMHFHLVRTKQDAINVDATVANNLEDKVDLPHYVVVTLVEEIGKAIAAYKVILMAKPIETIPNSIVVEDVMEKVPFFTNNASSAVVG